MTLTPEQIEAARAMALTIKTGAEDEAAEMLADAEAGRGYHEDLTDDAAESLEDAAVLAHALEALAAYARVAGLIDLADKSDSPFVFKDDLRRALTGG